MKKNKDFTMPQKEALADALANGELNRADQGEEWKGGNPKKTHQNHIVSSLISGRYLEIKKSKGLGVALKVIPTEKAVNCISVSA